MPLRNGKQVSAIPGLYLRSRSAIKDAVLELANVNTAPTTTSGYHYLYVESDLLKYDNGSSVITISGGGGTTPSWETLYAADKNFNITTGTWAISQSADSGLLTLTKTGTGAGTVLAIANAGTGNELSLTTTRASATGVVLYTHHDSASPADNDVILELSVNGDDSAGNTTEYAALQFLSTDVTDTTEDASMVLNLMYGGTQRNVMTMEGSTLKVGYGAAGVFSSQGNYDVTLQTGNATTSSITITDGAAGAITLAPDTTGVVVVTTGIQTGGTTPTACSFAVVGEGGGGTTGAAFSIDVTTLTTGTALQVDSASSSSGLLLDLQLATSSVFSVSETGATTIAGSAGNNVLSITAGDVVLTDGSLTITDADNANTVAITNSAATTGTVVAITADTVTTGIVMDINADGLTSGTILHLDTSAAGLTTGLYIDCYDGAASDFSVGIYGTTTIAGNAGSNVFVITAGDAVMSDGSLTITDADNAATVAVTNNTATTASVVTITADAVTTGIVLDINADGLTEGTILHLDSSAAGLTTGLYIDCYDGAASDFSVAANGATTIAGVAGSNVFTVTAGDLVVSDGSLTITDADNAATLVITNDTATTGNVVDINADALTEGFILHLDTSAAGLTTGGYIQCYDGAASDFTVGLHGATVIAGNAATDVFTITAGHAVITSGNLTLTSGNAVLTSGNLTLTAGNATLTAGNLTLTDGDITLTDGHHIYGTQAIVNANTAISITHEVTTIANNAGSTHTMADGVAGQHKWIFCTVYTADAVITPDNLANGTTVTFNAVGDGCEMIFTGTEWWVINLYGTAALA